MGINIFMYEGWNIIHFIFSSKLFFNNSETLGIVCKMWDLSVFFPQIVGPKIVASGDSTALPLLLWNSTDLQLNVPTKNAKVKKKSSLSEGENAQEFKICLLASSCSRLAYSCPLLVWQMAHSVQVCFCSISRLTGHSLQVCLQNITWNIIWG